MQLSETLKIKTIRRLKMERKDRRPGFTLVELLVVIGIMSLLAAGIAVVGSKVREGSQIKSTKATMSLLCSALCEYQNTKDIGSGFHFPVEPESSVFNYYAAGPPAEFGLIYAINSYLPQVSTTTIYPGQHNTFTWKDEDELEPLEKDSRLYAMTTIEFIYAVLEDVPECRAILEKIPNDRVVNEDNDSMSILDPSGSSVVEAKALLEVNDAWGHPLLYRTMGEGNFPELVSAGPDGLFGTGDDISTIGN